jgi:hypothetical protein
VAAPEASPDCARAGEAARPPSRPHWPDLRSAPRASLAFGGGSDGNEILTTTTGVLLILELAALGVTIVFIGRLLWEHLFVGLLAIGPVLLKMATTGYRFARYYLRDAVYVRRGPPWTPLRLIAPLVVVSTVVVFLTGVVLLLAGPADRDPWLLAHKASFIVWVVFTALHVAGHIPEVGRLLGVRGELINLPGIRTDLERRAAEATHPGRSTPPTAAAEARLTGGPGAPLRILALSVAAFAGIALAVALVPDFHAWTAAQPTFHHQSEHGPTLSGRIRPPVTPVSP